MYWKDFVDWVNYEVEWDRFLEDDFAL